MIKIQVYIEEIDDMTREDKRIDKRFEYGS
jgi:hypothetical protein